MPYVIKNKDGKYMYGRSYYNVKWVDDLQLARVYTKKHFAKSSAKQLNGGIRGLEFVEVKVNDESLLEMIKTQLVALADSYRADWSSFDGRTLKNQLYDLIAAIENDDPTFNEHIEWAENRY